MEVTILHQKMRKNPQNYQNVSRFTKFNISKRAVFAPTHCDDMNTFGMYRISL